VNPAPICVLDEVDRPAFDDANVEQLCKPCRDEMTAAPTPAFLVITHHGTPDHEAALAPPVSA